MSNEPAFRLFVAIYPPPGTASLLVKHLQALDLPRFRTTPPEQVHLTLQFIGDRAPHEMDEVRESVERSAAGLRAFDLQPIRLITIPPRGPARLIACETDAPPDLLELQRRLAHRLARSPRERAGDRFLPHLTLCRFSPPARARADLPLQSPAFPVASVLLMRSILKPQGAVHAEVARFMLE